MFLDKGKMIGYFFRIGVLYVIKQECKRQRGGGKLPTPTTGLRFLKNLKEDK